LALQNCPDCTAKVSDRAAACPNCGHPIAVPANRPRYPLPQPVYWLRVSGLLVAVAAIAIWVAAKDEIAGGASTLPAYFVSFAMTAGPFLIVAAVLFAAAEVVCATHRGNAD
jgi:hypothetical protein